MSYCRWSSDNWKSDLYIYASDMFMVNVASNRYEFDLRFPYPDINILEKDISAEDFENTYNQQRFAMDHAKKVRIQLPYAGETFAYDTGEEAAEFVRELSELGYHVPDGVIEALEEE